MRSMKKEDIKVTVIMPPSLDEIRKVWTNTYCDFAKSLLNDSGLSVEKKHEIIDELVASFKEGSRK